MIESFHVVVFDSHDQIIGEKRFDSFPTEDQIKETIRCYEGCFAYVVKRYQDVPFE